MEFTEGSIQKILSHFLTAPLYDVDNLYVFSWESDKLLKTRAGYFYEFEIKISRADYKNDFKNKRYKHTILGSCFSDDHKKPNYFYYAVPEGLIDVSEVPEYAGLVYILDDSVLSFSHIRIVKKAPLLHKEKYDDGQLGLGEKFYYNMVNWRNKAREWQKMYYDKLIDLKTELANKGQEMTYKEMQTKLDETKESEERFKRLYYTRLDDADYKAIERRLLMKKIKEFDQDFDFSDIWAEADRLYKERKIK